MSSNLCEYTSHLCGGPVFLINRMTIILNCIWSRHFGSIPGEVCGAIAAISFGMVLQRGKRNNGLAHESRVHSPIREIRGFVRCPQS